MFLAYILLQEETTRLQGEFSFQRINHPSVQSKLSMATVELPSTLPSPEKSHISFRNAMGNQ
jgi:hypothetical protein